MKADETYIIMRVKKTDRRVDKIFLSEPYTPTMARRRIFQNEALKLFENKDRYLQRFIRKLWVLRNKGMKTEGLTYADLTKNELQMMQETRNIHKVDTKEDELICQK